MDPIRHIRLQFATVRFPQFAPAAWQPPINAFRCEKALCIYVDLAGVDKSEIDLSVQNGRLSIHGVREAPEPQDNHDRALQVLAMEIDYGAFHRDLRLPDDVDVERIEAEQRNGLLWIYLPLKQT
jgi:HSP20 family protein